MKSAGKDQPPRAVESFLGRLDHFSINSRDPTRLARWYQKILGLEMALEMKKKGRPPVYFIKAKPRLYLEIQDSKWNPHTCFEVENFWKTIEKLVEKGVTMKIVRKTSIGWLAGFFEDPEGNIIEILFRDKPIQSRFVSSGKN